MNTKITTVLLYLQGDECFFIEFFAHSVSYRVWMGVLSKCKFVLSRQASVIACDVDWQVCGACQHCVDEDESLKPPDATVTQDQLHRSNQFIFVC